MKKISEEECFALLSNLTNYEYDSYLNNGYSIPRKEVIVEAGKEIWVFDDEDVKIINNYLRLKEIHKQEMERFRQV